MKKLGFMMLPLLFLLTMLPGPISANGNTEEQSISQSEVKFENEFRRLWFDHVLWTSNYNTSATTAGAEDHKQVLSRLLKNQEDIGNTVKSIYGEDAGSKLADLLKEHIGMAGKIVDAAKNGKEDMVHQLNQECN
ncbi:hypothetical protein SAMN05192559_11239 [Halobacillus karajensis]|uniref:DUF305 domain-containing protein n=1 Tax=Halobacillus karajensis TaxID=195088 RepID=A0A024PB62_9BACI|nr:hypothetical protein [Halobacillus karajensis]CDQ21273.1 hypothetical protein BN982_03639 [Halobacillus karajensis]CDQ25657.1 hypothetical protein BN983_04014 [Halobacillus karajensis]CDQ25928.1 hypothetical protein BN981_00135 [Halobacillus karajensis]SEI10247.1 hypothetical protein SAMN05192559_11239 [Halobacillus karajensis]